LAIAILSAGFGLSLLFQDQSPLISQITPRVGNPGEVMVIDGSYFGHDRNRSTVTIAGIRVTASSVLEWSPQRISFRIPDEVRSGSVVVQTPAGRSKAQAFTSQNQIPRIAQNNQSAISASLQSSQPVFCWPGDPVVLKGRNFGTQRGSLRLLVDGRQVDDRNIIEWSDSAITLRMPMFARQAVVKLQSPEGTSNSFTVPLQKGPVSLSAGAETKEYHLGLLYDIGDVELLKSPAWGIVRAYIPLPPQLLEQERTGFSSAGGRVDADAAVDGSLVFCLDNPEPDLAYHLTAEYTIKRRALLLSAGSDPETGYGDYQVLVKRHTRASPLVPEGDAGVRAFVKAAVKAEARPLARARLIYHAVLARLAIDPGAGMTFASQVLADGKANSFGYANLLVSALRAAGIPAQLLEGVLVDADGKAQPHLWAEFFIPTVGWVQADPAMGDGLLPSIVPRGADPAAWYFGNIDNRHLVLSEGETPGGLTRIDSTAQKLFQHFVLMQAHAGSGGNVDSFGLFIASPELRVVR
jgi:transglutaminase-like putative cysteine protease